MTQSQKTKSKSAAKIQQLRGSPVVAPKMHGAMDLLLRKGKGKDGKGKGKDVAHVPAM